MRSKIKQERQRLRMTQRELAQRADLSKATVSRLERGKAPSATVGTLRKLAAALGGTVGDIFLPPEFSGVNKGERRFGGEAPEEE